MTFNHTIPPCPLCFPFIQCYVYLLLSFIGFQSPQRIFCLFILLFSLHLFSLVVFLRYIISHLSLQIYVQWLNRLDNPSLLYYSLLECRLELPLKFDSIYTNLFYLHTQSVLTLYTLLTLLLF